MNTEYKQTFQYENETGDAALTVYTVYPGIQVVYNAVHMDRFDLNFPTITGRFIEIQHCMEGRIEQCAAKELISTDRPIAEIAAKYGYINESKFSSAFKSIILYVNELDKLVDTVAAFYAE